MQPLHPAASPFATLQGRHAVVTGASSGIGRAIALELARAGATLDITYRQSHAEAEHTARLIHSLGSRCEIWPLDMNDVASVETLTARISSANGVPDIWINNAGADLLTTPEAKAPYLQKLQLLCDVDLRGTMLLTRAVGQRMKSVGRGAILNIGWDQADRGMEGDSGELFAAVKNAIMGFTRSCALSLAPEVRVNCIAPGWIRTAWGAQASEIWQERVLRETPLKRWGEPEDIARAARFLVSDAAEFITGQVLNVNGGVVR